jgi:hypothetical protein
MTVSTLRFTDVGTIQLAVGDIALYQGLGGYRLTVAAKATAPWLNEQDPGSSGVALVNGSIWLNGTTHRYLAEIAQTSVILRGFPVGVDLAVEVSDEKLAVLEQVRAGGSLDVHMNLTVTLLDPGTAQHQPGVVPATDQVSIRVPAARWTEVMDQAGAGVAITLHVPSPLDEWTFTGREEYAPSVTRAVRRLREARDALRDGQFEEAVSKCRLALEGIQGVQALPSEKEVDNVVRRLRTQDQRWAALNHDMTSLLSVPHHDDTTTAAFTWGRAEAEVALVMTAAILRKYTT